MAHFYLASLLAFVSAQDPPDTICIWESTGDEWDRYNGEYAIQGNDFNNEAWWLHSTPNTNCPTGDNPAIFAASWSNNRYWQVMPDESKDTAWQAHYPDCEDMNTDDPSLCTATNWKIYDDTDAVIATMSWTVTASTCPTLPCHRISITASGNDE
eukprot:336696_1